MSDTPLHITSHPRVGISSCLLGNAVRYNGSHKAEPHLKEVISHVFEWVPCCPEIAIGLGVPRSPIHLRRMDDAIQAVDTLKGGQDLSMQLAAEAKHLSRNVPDLAGYVFKQGSPSCGLTGVRLYDRSGQHPISEGRGVFGAAMASIDPLLPLAEEGDLHDARQRTHFIIRVQAYHRWKLLVSSGMSFRKLSIFHSRHKYLLLAHNPEKYRSLGSLMAQADRKVNLNILERKYKKLFMLALSCSPDLANQADVLHQISGYFRKHIGTEDHAELVAMIESYRQGDIPFSAPLVSLRYYSRLHPPKELDTQYYLDEYPCI